MKNLGKFLFFSRIFYENQDFSKNLENFRFFFKIFTFHSYMNFKNEEQTTPLSRREQQNAYLHSFQLVLVGGNGPADHIVHKVRATSTLIRAYHRGPAGHGFVHGKPPGLVPGRQREDVGHRVDGRQFALIAETEEPHPIQIAR